VLAVPKRMGSLSGGLLSSDLSPGYYPGLSAGGVVPTHDGDAVTTITTSTIFVSPGLL